MWQVSGSYRTSHPGGGTGVCRSAGRGRWPWGAAGAPLLPGAVEPRFGRTCLRSARVGAGSLCGGVCGGRGPALRVKSGGALCGNSGGRVTSCSSSSSSSSSPDDDDDDSKKKNSGFNSFKTPFPAELKAPGGLGSTDDTLPGRRRWGLPPGVLAVLPPPPHTGARLAA